MEQLRQSQRSEFSHTVLPKDRAIGKILASIEPTQATKRVINSAGDGYVEAKLEDYNIQNTFNVKDDPAEQINRIDHSDCQEIRQQLDTELTTMMLRSITQAHSEKTVGTSWKNLEFGAGWFAANLPYVNCGK